MLSTQINSLRPSIKSSDISFLNVIQHEYHNSVIIDRFMLFILYRFTCTFKFLGMCYCKYPCWPTCIHCSMCSIKYRILYILFCTLPSCVRSRWAIFLQLFRSCWLLLLIWLLLFQWWTELLLSITIPAQFLTPYPLYSWMRLWSTYV